MSVMNIEQMATEFVALAKQITDFCRDNTIKVLLVEDNPMDTEITRIQLESLKEAGGRNYKLDVATNSEDARRIISERRHNLVILDWQLGEGEHTGMDLARQLHADGVQFPFVILTGREEDYTEAASEDCLGWLNKRTADAKALDAGCIHAVKNWYSRKGISAPNL